ncbi:DUF962 domain-containing protein [Pseudoxanthomonas sangjuensis]|uniref:Mpo1 family 2-hydroxy fatty acid dioxygenase n=1 Tax=Pseudoxanthomonas sangjuensis TaxID=1503750 RepID=UPI001391FDAC|nr:Mpo1-like protein [Pseudoxanthomonas sangjuensis]KAF1713919.1 hypothetical protein CSC71_05965 [Pseudoxanthomonas sangjuensis]
MNATAGRPIDRFFANYSNDHRNPTNQLIHTVCVPAILWSVIALLWCIPVLGSWFKPGVWAALAMFAAWMYYYRLSRPIGFGMLVVFFTMACICRLVAMAYGTGTLLWAAIAVFVAAWIGQFVGHSKLFEGRKPSFFTDLTYLLIGPIWVLAKFYRKMGWKY